MAVLTNPKQASSPFVLETPEQTLQLSQNSESNSDAPSPLPFALSKN